MRVALFLRRRGLEFAVIPAKLWRAALTKEKWTDFVAIVLLEKSPFLIAEVSRRSVQVTRQQQQRWSSRFNLITAFFLPRMGGWTDPLMRTSAPATPGGSIIFYSAFINLEKFIYDVLFAAN